MYMYKIKYMRGGKPNNLATTMSNIRFKFTIILVIMTILMIIPISTHAKDEDKTNQNIKLGDINMDSKIDSSDLLLLLRHVYASENGKKQEWILTGNKFLAGDITRNKKIDSSDTIAILRHIAAIGNKEIGNKHKDWIIKEEESITLNKTSIELKIGESEKLEVTSSENEKITWSSSNEKVAIVDSEGKVTAKGEGEATITARTERGKEVQCKVTVKVIEILATNIKLNKNTIELEVGKSEKLQVTIEPENVTNKTVSWSSSNETVATVDNEGKVTARGEGEATIVAKTSNGKEAKCTIKVKPVEIYATSIKLNKETLRIASGKEENLQATIEPANAINKTIIWTSSNEQVAIVDSKGKITAKNDGTATITAETSNGKIAKCEVKVGLLKGIDVSDYQGNNIDWKKVAQSQDFAIIRVGGRGSSSGQIYEDYYWERNVKEATSAGIKVGIYFYSTAITAKEVEEEANWVIEKIKGYNITYPVIIDQEYDARLSVLTSEQRTEIAIKFLEIVEKNGYIPMYYGEQTLVNMTRLSKYDFWLAHYTYSIDKPSGYLKEYNCTIWQYSDEGIVDGIEGAVDMNVGYKDY